jgi:hypothetical protein
VPVEQTFSGFGHPATLIVALVLIVSAGLMRSGAVNWLARLPGRQGPPGAAAHRDSAAPGALMSGFMNNIAALALLMPIDTQTARKAKRAVGMTLMPLSFATILGRHDHHDRHAAQHHHRHLSRRRAWRASFAMFDFTPVGGAVALAGLLFVALIGWRLLPERVRRYAGAQRGARRIHRRTGGSRRSRSWSASACARSRTRPRIRTSPSWRAARGQAPLRGRAQPGACGEDDVLLVEASPEALEEFRSELKLEFPEADKTDSKSGKKDEERSQDGHRHRHRGEEWC